METKTNGPVQVKIPIQQEFIFDPLHLTARSRELTFDPFSRPRINFC